MIKSKRGQAIVFAVLGVACGIIMVFPHVLGPMARKSPGGIRVGAALGLAFMIANLVPSMRRWLDEW